MSNNFNNAIWDDLPIASKLRFGANAPTLDDLRPNIKLLKFSPNVMNEVFASVQLPHDYKEGTDVKIHVHWAHNSAVNDGHFVFIIESSWANTGAPGDVIPSTNQTVITGIQVLGADQYKNQIKSLVTLTGTGKKISSEIFLKLFRDPNNPDDTSTSGIFLIEFDAHYQKDSNGSVNEITK